MVEVSESEFNEFLKSKTGLIKDFFMDWHCFYDTSVKEEDKQMIAMCQDIYDTKTFKIRK